MEITTKDVMQHQLLYNKHIDKKDHDYNDDEDGLIHPPACEGCRNNRAMIKYKSCEHKVCDQCDNVYDEKIGHICVVCGTKVGIQYWLR